MGEDCVKCFLGSVVTPGEYWMVSQMHSHVKDVREIEKMLSEEMNETLTMPETESLVCGVCVAVENPSARGTWQRGRVVEILNDNKFKVFLVDSGCFTEVDLKHLQLIRDLKYITIEPLAFRLCLYGLVPCLTVNGVRNKISNHWTPVAKYFIKNLFSQRLLFFVKNSFTINRTVYGDLYVLSKPGGHIFSLGRLLCTRGYCFYSELYFKEKVIDTSLTTASGTVIEKDTAFSGLNVKLNRTPECALSAVEHQKDCSKVSRSCSNRHLKPGEYEKSNNGRSKCNLVPTKNVEWPKGPSNNGKFSTGHGKAAVFPKLNQYKKQFQVTLQSSSMSQTRNRFVEIECETGFRIFTVFNDSIIQPVSKFRNLNMPQHIIMNLEKQGRFVDLSPIQRWAIPAIQRGLNVVMIGSTRTGKTLAYIIPLLEMLLDKVESGEVSDGNGPVAIILCSGARSCEFIYNTCKVLLGNNIDKQKSHSTVRVEMAHGNGCERNIWVHLTNGCELLISTPHCLTRLLKYIGITNMERLSFLVLDDVDVLIQEPFSSPVKCILQQSKYSKECQVVFCGEKWTPELKHLVNVFAKNHAVLIGSYLEAAVYSRLKPSALFVETEMKPQVLLNNVCNKINECKILIACEYTSDVLLLQDVFEANGYAPLVAHSDMVIHDIKDLHGKWKSSKADVLICTDDIIQQLAIDDVQLLVHYSLPVESKTNFGNRFSTLMKSYESNLENIAEQSNVIILVDDKNHFQLPHIVEFVERLGGKIPNEILQLSKEITWTIETSKVDIPLCSSFLEFGECKKKEKCSKRHALIKEIDFTSVPVSGTVRFEILHVTDVCHLSVKIIEFIKKNGARVKHDDFSDEIQLKMKEYYECEENRKFLGTASINEVCAMELSDSNGKRFVRVKIMEYKKFNKENRVSEVLVKSIDIGFLSRVTIYNLYELPEELKKYKPQAIDVYICNLLPNDFDTNWSEEVTRLARNFFMRELKKDEFWIGKIFLFLNFSMHLYSVKLCRLLNNLHTYVIDSIVHKKFQSLKMVVLNESNVDKWRSLCKRADIETLPYEEKEDDQIVEPEWAFFDRVISEVEFCTARSTSVLLFRVTKFLDLIRKVEKNCVIEANRIKSSSANVRNLWTPKVGMYCLAAYKNTWRRGRIISVEGNMASIFFIDYGVMDQTENVLPLPETLLTQLPAQIIECSLVGVKHELPVSEKVLEKIFTFSNNGREILYVTASESNQSPELTRGKKYDVNVVNKEGVSLNNRLVSEEFVLADEANFHLAQHSKEIVCSFATRNVDREEDSDDSELSSVVQEEILDENEGFDASDSFYFFKMGDEGFNDESAELFLKEFVDQTFTDAKEEQIKDVPKPETRELITQVKEIKEKSGQCLHSVKNTSATKEAKPFSICKIANLTPQVIWSQNHSQVEMKVMLNNVKTYKIDGSSTHFVFRCVLNEKSYVACLCLFGSVNPDLTEVRLRPFFVHIILKKLCPLPWPRLHRDRRKYRWINIDADEGVDGRRQYSNDVYKKDMSGAIQNGLREAKPNELDFIKSTDSEDDSLDYSSDEDSDSCI